MNRQPYKPVPEHEQRRFYALEREFNESLLAYRKFSS